MRILGIDYGDARIGLALSDASATLCGRAWTLTEWNLDRAVDAIADVVRTEGVERIVLGLPKNMDGTEGPRAEKSRMVAQRLTDATGLEVVLWDILVSEGSCDLIVSRDIAPYLLQNVTSAGRVKLSVSEIELSDLSVPELKVKEIRDTVSTLRLDAVAASLILEGYLGTLH